MAMVFSVRQRRRAKRKRACILQVVMSGFVCYVIFVTTHLAEHTNLEKERSVVAVDSRTPTVELVTANRELEPVAAVPKTEGDGTVHDAGVMEELDVADAHASATQAAVFLRKEAESMAGEQVAPRAETERRPPSKVPVRTKEQASEAEQAAEHGLDAAVTQAAAIAARAQVAVAKQAGSVTAASEAGGEGDDDDLPSDDDNGTSSRHRGGPIQERNDAAFVESPTGAALTDHDHVHNNVNAPWRSLWRTNHVNCSVLKPGEFGVTLVTQTSLDRATLIEELCNRWTGPLVIVVYSVGMDSPELPKCHGQADLYVAKARRELDPEAYPVNKLRNMAISHVKTSHYFLIDIDMWPSSELYPLIMKMSAPARPTSAHLFSDPLVALIVPVFTYEGNQDPNAARRYCGGYQCKSKSKKYRGVVPVDYSALKKCIIKRECFVFDYKNPHGHSTTDYVGWIRQGQDRIRDLSCFGTRRYEPYVIVRKCASPKFDERFTGYGKNKIQHLYHMRWEGFRFGVFPRGFIIHVPHEKSKAKLMWDIKDSPDHNSAQRMSHRERMDNLYSTFCEEIKRSSPFEKSPPTPICKSSSSTRRKKGK